MKMVRQNANCDGFEWIPLLDISIDMPETVNLIDQQIARAFGKNDSEKENAAFGSNISGHDASYHGYREPNGGHASLCPPYGSAYIVNQKNLRGETTDEST